MAATTDFSSYPFSTIKFNSPPIRPNFSLPDTIIHYILQNSLVSKNLPLTCKYILGKTKIVLFATKIYFENNKLFCFIDNDTNWFPVPIGEVKYWLTKKLVISKNILDFCEPFYRCDVTTISISNNNLTLSDINFLLSSQRINEVYLYDVNIRDNDRIPVSIDIILSKVSNITHLYYDNVYEIIDSKTIEKLNSLKFNQKFKRFQWNVQKLLEVTNPSPLAEFIKNNAADESKIFFHFYLPYYEKWEATMKYAINKVLEKWKFSETKPNVLCGRSM